MVEHEGESEKGFKIVDRRRFSADGDLKADAAPDRVRTTVAVPTAPATSPSQPGAAKNEPKRPEVASEEAHRPQAGEPAPEIDFMTFVASLATNALAAMGALPEGRAQGLPIDPQMAREYIDIIAMLQMKTRGNLSMQEDQALQRLLTELRMHFVEFTRAVSRPPPPRR